MARSSNAKAKKKTGQGGSKTARRAVGRTRRPARRSKRETTAQLLLLAVEWLGLLTVGLAAIVVLLGYFFRRFSGTDVMASLLPFAAGVLGLVVASALMILAWTRLRRWLVGLSSVLPVCLVGMLVLTSGLVVSHERLTPAWHAYRSLLGGKEEASRLTLAHQVYASYRRLESDHLTTILKRSEAFQEPILDAARATGVDADLLLGLAAVESSYLPRESHDGGQGLFQVTLVPAVVQKEVNLIFPAGQQRLAEAKYNAHMGAATLHYYLDEMKGDLFLGLLAYNIGPANGGLRFIMEQYGASDFITIQPYLAKLPRDYPIRVLAHALAFRLFRQTGTLLAYEEGNNALRIQALGIPGLD